MESKETQAGRLIRVALGRHLLGAVRVGEKRNWEESGRSGRRVKKPGMENLARAKSKVG